MSDDFSGLISESGVDQWFKDGCLHREDGPAYINKSDGYKSWWRYDKRHRTDGPAIERADGSKQWWINGKLIPCKTQEEFERLMRLKAFW